MRKILFIFLIFPFFIHSQSKNISGTVSDENGTPLPGATVQLKGSDSVGAITDFDGNFSLSIANDSSNILVISYIGYVNLEVDVSNQLSINVNLQPDTEALEEVVVVGYGTVLKRDLTGAVSSVVVDDEVSRQSATVDQLLQGRAAGVQVTQNSANPNSGVSVRIRGTNSLRGNNEPLYVIDGVIISSAGEDVIPTGSGNTGQEAQSGLNGLNPRDIERIEVLKDASATAIYGSRGANGVVLITTKSGGDEEKGKINAYVTTTVRDITNTYDMLDGAGYAMYQNSIRASAGESDRYVINGDQVFSFIYDQSGNQTATVDSTPNQVHDWQDEIYDTGVSTNFGVSFSGGNEKGDYYLSAGFNDLNGLIESSSFKTQDIRLNLNYDLNEKVRIEARLSSFFSKSNFAEGGDLIGGDQSFTQQTLTYNPIIPNDADNIEDFVDGQTISNPYSWINDFTDESRENRLIASLAIKYKFNTPGLQYEFKVGGNLRDKDRSRFYGLTTWQGANANGMLQKMKLNALTYQVNNFLRYNRNINKNHRVNAALGVTYDVRDVESSVYAVEDFVTAQLGTAQPFLGQVISTPLLLRASDQQLFSVLGRVNYTFKKYGVFPSFAFAWRAGSEKFIRDLDLFSSLKVRAGWGAIGNHGIGPYGTLSNYGASSSLYGTSTNGTTVPLILANIANPDLTWESTEQLNFGIDFGFSNGRVSGTIDLYEKTTKDLLQQSPIPTSSGFSSILINRGSLENKGLEIGLDLALVDSGDFTLNIGGNIAFNNTEIQNLGLSPGKVLVDNGDGTNSTEKRAHYFGRQPSRGNSIKFPVNIFMEGEEVALFYGINLDFSYKALSISALFNGVSGNEIVNGNLYRMGWAEGTYRNVLSEAYHNRWTESNPTNEYPRLGYSSNLFGALMDRVIEDGTYLRLNNITVSYDVPTDSVSFIESANVYVTGQNLFTWTDYSGYDPEITTFLYDGLIQGTDWNNKPNSQSFLVGINLNF